MQRPAFTPITISSKVSINLLITSPINEPWTFLIPNHTSKTIKLSVPYFLTQNMSLPSVHTLNSANLPPQTLKDKISCPSLIDTFPAENYSKENRSFSKKCLTNLIKMKHPNHNPLRFKSLTFIANVSSQMLKNNPKKSSLPFKLIKTATSSSTVPNQCPSLKTTQWTSQFWGNLPVFNSLKTSFQLHLFQTKEKLISYHVKYWMLRPFKMIIIWTWLTGQARITWQLVWHQVYTYGMQETQRSQNFVISVLLILARQSHGQ